MSNPPESSSLDLDQLFLPAWAQESSAINKYAHFEGRDTSDHFRDRRPSDRRDRPPRREFGDRPRPEGGDRSGPPRDRGFQDRRGPRREGDRRPAPTPPPLPAIEMAFVPEEKGVEGIVRQIRSTGRAFPLFDIALMILKRPERYNVIFSVQKKTDGQVAQPLFVCSLDETLWLSEQEAVDYVLRKHFSTFYQTERIPAEPPKGVFTFVAQCGMSGIILGPPNCHDYQTKLRKLHAERFSHLPFEVYKARVKIVKDEAVVNKWREDQSFTTEFVCLNVPEPKKLTNRDEVEKHFRETHLANVIHGVESFTIGGLAGRSQPCPAVANLLRYASEEQRRFPLKIATVLSQQFASHGLQFFKFNKTITHVSVARPHFLDLNSTTVTEEVKRIVNYINTNPKTTRRKLIEAFFPGAMAVETAPAAPAPAPAEGAPAEGASAGPPPAAPQPSAAVNPEVGALISDLHWLIHEGHVIEYASGILENAKAPPPRVVRPPRPPKTEGQSVTPAGPAVSEPAPASVEVLTADQAAAGLAAEGTPAPEPAPEVAAAGQATEGTPATPLAPEAPAPVEPAAPTPTTPPSPEVAATSPAL